MMRLSQPNGTPQGISGGKDHQKHLDISVTGIRFNLLRITRIHTETDLNIQPWPDLHLISSNNMRIYTHVPSSVRRASTGSADGWTTWTVGGTETERRHAAGPAPKSAKHRHTAMQQLPCDPALDGDRSRKSKRKDKAWLGWGEEREKERGRAPVQSRNPPGQSKKIRHNMKEYKVIMRGNFQWEGTLHVFFMSASWCAGVSLL